MKNLSGISVLEIMIAVTVFIIIGSGALAGVVMSYKTTRTSNDNTEAVLYAQEGVEAVRHLRSTDWTIIENGTYGLDLTNGYWELIADTPDTWDKYTRTIVVSDVERDGDGNIVESGGTIDPNSKRVTVSVDWIPSGLSAKNITETLYLSNWVRAIPSPRLSMMVYVDHSGDTDEVMYRTLFKGDDLTSEVAVDHWGFTEDEDISALELFSMEDNEKILITKHYNEVPNPNVYSIYANVWDGDSWGNSILLSSYDEFENDQTHSRNFSGFYLDRDEFVVVYSSGDEFIKARIWDGSNWSVSEDTVGEVVGEPVWIKGDVKPGSNDAMIAVRDTNKNLHTFFYNGTSWNDNGTLASDTQGIQFNDMDLTWTADDPDKAVIAYYGCESQSQNLCLNDWNGSSWSSTVENNMGGGKGWFVSLTDRPTDNTLLACSKSHNKNLNCTEFDDDLTTIDIFSGIEQLLDTQVESPSYDSAYETSSGQVALIVYGEESDGGNVPRYRLYNPNLPTNQKIGSENQLQALNDEPTAIKIIPHPESDIMAIFISDKSEKLYMMFWDGNQFYVLDEDPDPDDERIIAENGLDSVEYWYDFDW